MPGVQKLAFFFLNTSKWCCVFTFQIFTYLLGCVGSQLQRAGSSSPTRDGTRAPALGAWSPPLDQREVLTTGLSLRLSPPPPPGESTPTTAQGPARQQYLSCSWTRWPQFRDFTWF